MKEILATNTVWSLGAVIYDRVRLTELWFGTRLATGERVSAKIEKPLPDILLAGLPAPDDDPDSGFVLLDHMLEEYERIAEPPDW